MASVKGLYVMIISLCLFSLGVACYGISQLQQQSKLRWQKAGTGFWDEGSYLRKYKKQFSDHGPAFPFSTTALVFLTDGYHLMQWFYIKLFVASIILYSPMFSWWVDGLVYLGVWYLTFNIVYKIFSK